MVHGVVLALNLSFERNNANISQNARLKANYDKSQYTANFYDSTGKRFRRHKKED